MALEVARRGIAMFEKVNVKILGIVENMSYHLCRIAASTHEIFAHGGGARLATALGVPFLGEVPITRELREGGDSGNPLVAAHPDHPVSDAFRSIAANVIAHL